MNSRKHFPMVLVALALSLVALLAPTEVLADPVTSVGDGLVNGITVSGLSSNASCYVWMGGDGNPVLWRVIGKGDGRWLLISSDVMSDEMNYNSIVSLVGTLANDIFSSVELDAIPPTTKIEPDDYLYTYSPYSEGYSYRYYTAASVNRERLFLLSAEEAETYFNGAGDRKVGLSKDSVGYGRSWWLRSPYNLNNAGKITQGIVVYAQDFADLRDFTSDGTYLGGGARPAFQLDLGHVLFTSAAEGDKSSASDGSFGTIYELSGSSNNEVKLTLLDQRSDSPRAGFAASVAPSTALVEGDITISYSGAADGDNVSALICEGDDVLYYASTEQSADGTWTVTLPNGLHGSYTLKVFSEERNGEKETDYASPCAELALTVVNPAVAPTIDAEPQDLSLTYGYDEGSLSVTASGAEGHELSYQWYACEEDKSGAQEVDGAQAATFDVPTGKSVGTYYYFCRVTATNGDEQTASADSSVAKVIVGKASATITVDNASKVVGEENPIFTGTVEGLVAEGDLGTISYKCTIDADKPGTFKGVLTATYTANDNYDVTVVPGDFRIRASYTMVWLDGDGSELDKATWVEDDDEPTTDKTPSKQATKRYTYTFSSWDDGSWDSAGTTKTHKPLFDEEVNKYTITFVDEDGSKLQSDEIAYGAIPAYKGATPTKQEDAENTYAFAGWSPEVQAVYNDATYTATYTAEAKAGVYRLKSGGGVWTKGSGKTLPFTFVRTVDDASAFSHFTGIKVDGKAVSAQDSSGKANYVAKSGSVVVTLQSAYLETLKTGEHTLTATFDDGDPVDAAFTVQVASSKKSTTKDTKATKSTKSTLPKTSDSFVDTLPMLAIGAGAGVGLLLAGVALRRKSF